jgi:hypothetical protein
LALLSSGLPSRFSDAKKPWWYGEYGRNGRCGKYGKYGKYGKNGKYGKYGKYTECLVALHEVVGRVAAA